MKAQKIASLLLLILSPIVATAAPDKASGTVISVIDAKTFEVMIEETDPRILQTVERVTLADIQIPNGSIDGSVEELIDESLKGSMNVLGNESMEESSNRSTNESGDGPIDESLNGSFNGSIRRVDSAEDFAVAILLNKTVWLDIDDRSPDGRNSDGELVAVLRLSGLDGRPVISPTFNRMLVDCGIAEVNDSLENEFDPSDWWPPRENGTEEEVSGEDAGKKTTGLNIDINPSKPEININLAKPKVNVSLSGFNVDINPRKPVINVNPKKPVIDVNPSQANETENETADPLNTSETADDADDAETLRIGEGSEPVILKNLAVPITLVDPAGAITVINSTGEVTVIDPARPVKVINSTDLVAANIPGQESAESFQEPTKITEAQIEEGQPSTRGRRR